MIKEYAIIGGGIGGCSIAALLNAKGHDVTLIEKEPYLGGCAATFKHKGNLYNAGATTLSGYHEGGMIKKLFDTVGVVPNLLSSDPSIAIIHGEKICLRYRDPERFIEEVQRFYHHPKHEPFWRLVHTLVNAFYAQKSDPYYSNRSFFKKIQSLCSFYPVLKTFYPYLFRSAREFIQRFYGEVSDEYIDFIDAQILIVAQAKSDQVNFFTAALALGYTFQETHYPIGGMGGVCDSLVSNVADVRKGCEVTRIQKKENYYVLSSNYEIIQAKNIIMGTSHFESSMWFEEADIKKYYSQYEQKNNFQSAFLLYMTIRSDETFYHHYQLISDSNLPYCTSNALFVSLSDPSDTQMAPQGYYRITASIHTDSRYWLSLSRTEYRAQKKSLQYLIQGWICDRLSLSSERVVESFAATPKTFGRYINRTQLGGNAMTMSNLFPLLPSNDTPIEGFYQVGDTSYAAQGWPGVVMGAFNCMRLIDG